MASTARSRRIAVFTKNRTNPAYVGARLGADRVAARFGCRTVHFVPVEPDDIAEQRSLLGQALAEGFDAILFAPTHPTALNNSLMRVQERGIPLLCMVSCPDGIEPACSVGSDDHALAYAIADHLFRHMSGAGPVVAIDGHPNAMTSAPRAAGFRSAAVLHPDIRISESCSGGFQFEGGKAAMTGLLQRHAQIDGVLAANDFMALGAIEAMRAFGRSSPIVGVNATPEGVGAIRAGDLLASASFDAMKMACLGTEAAVRLLRGEIVPSRIVLPVEIVDRSNFTAWDLPYEARPLPEWDRCISQ